MHKIILIIDSSLSGANKTSGCFLSKWRKEYFVRNKQWCTEQCLFVFPAHVALSLWRRLYQAVFAKSVLIRFPFILLVHLYLELEQEALFSQHWHYSNRKVFPCKLGCTGNPFLLFTRMKRDSCIRIQPKHVQVSTYGHKKLSN